MVRQSPLKTLESNDDPDEGLDGAFSFPHSLSAAFGNSPDVSDGGLEPTCDREYAFWTRSLEWGRESRKGRCGGNVIWSPETQESLG